MFRLYIWFIFAILPNLVFSKTLVFTTAFNRPDFVELQYALLQKFLHDEFEYMVFCDASDSQMIEKMQVTCDSLGVKCILIPQHIHDMPYLPRNPKEKLPYHNPNVRHCNGTQWAWDNFIVKHKGPVLLVDSDMFPVRPFSVQEILGENAIGGVLFGTKDQVTAKPYSYLSLMLIMFDMERLPEVQSICFNCGILPDTNAIVDSGGNTFFYLQKYANLLKVAYFDWKHGHTFYCPYRYASPQSQPKEIPQQIIIENLTKRGFTDLEIKLALEKPDTIEFLCNNHFLHYRAGSNYEKDSLAAIKRKTDILSNYFNALLSND